MPQFVRLGLVLGLSYGLFEALEAVVLSFIPGALSWRVGNSPRVLWVAPIIYGAIGAACGLSFFALSRTTGRIDWTKAAVFFALLGGGFLAAMLQGKVFSPLASLLLAAGIATQLVRAFSRRRERLLALVPKLAVGLLVVVAAIALAEISLTAARERWLLARLPQSGPRPNVLLLVANTLRGDHLSGFGYQRPTTPRLDRLARESRSYTHAYSASSWTLPSHASLMTGRHLHEHHAGEQHRPYLDGRFATLAEVLGAAGYASGGFVANTFWVGRNTGLARGFVHYDDFYGNIGDAFARTVIGRLLAYHLLPRFGWVDIPGRRNAADINERVLEWIDGLGGRPFFAFANYMDVHSPYTPPEPYKGRFSAGMTQERANFIDLGHVTLETKLRDPEALRAAQARYDESLLYLDEQVGRLMDELARRGVLDRTIVVFTSDHGESWGEHGLIYHGHSLYLDQVDIPLIVRYPPALPLGERKAAPVGLDEVPGMITSLAGIASAPFASSAATQPLAFSAAPQRTGVPPAWPTASGTLRSVQDDRWQLIVSSSGKAELYDIATDRAQMHDLSGDARFAATLAALRGRLDRELAASAKRGEAK